MQRVFIDSWASSASELGRGKKTMENLLRALMTHPRISTFDLTSKRWLWRLVGKAEKEGLIQAGTNDQYPWHTFTLTKAGEEWLLSVSPPISVTSTESPASASTNSPSSTRSRKRKT